MAGIWPSNEGIPPESNGGLSVVSLSPSSTEHNEEALRRLALPTQFPSALMKAAGDAFDLNCMQAADTVLLNMLTIFLLSLFYYFI